MDLPVIKLGCLKFELSEGRSSGCSNAIFEYQRVGRGDYPVIQTVPSLLRISSGSKKWFQNWNSYGKSPCYHIPCVQCVYQCVTVYPHNETIFTSCRGHPFCLIIASAQVEGRKGPESWLLGGRAPRMWHYPSVALP